MVSILPKIRIIPYIIVSYCIITYQFSATIPGRSLENLCSARISNKKSTTKGKRRQKKAKETD
jgi:hypothetical protein